MKNVIITSFPQDEFQVGGLKTFLQLILFVHIIVYMS